jgi:hypothetical protein
MASDGNECARRICLWKYETVLNMTTSKALGLRCADIDPAERGRVDRIGIPQRKKTGSLTAAMGQ